MFISRFIAVNVFCSCAVLAIMLVKKLLGKRISQKVHYYIWFLLIVSMLMVFIPSAFLEQFRHVHPDVTGVTSEIPNGISDGNISHTYVWPTDVADAVALKDDSQAKTILYIIWFIGIAAVSLLYLKSMLWLWIVGRHATEPNKRLRTVLKRCCERIGARRKIRLLQSPSTKNPMSFGVLFPCIVVPDDMTAEVHGKELEHIMLHEVMHILHRDTLINLLLCVLQALFWCNPFIWLAFSQMRQDREIYCDWTVLNSMETQAERLSYGYTLLHFAETQRRFELCTENRLGGCKAQMRKRIEMISSFSKQTKKSVVFGISACVVVSVLVAVQFQTLADFSGNSDFYSPQTGMEIREIDCGELFGDGEGSAVVYDMNTGEYTAWNVDNITKRISPCSTYKIYSALNALELRIITPERNLLYWNGRNNPFPAWDSDQTLNSAMRNSVNWYFQNLDACAGIEELSEFFRNIGYGNCDVGRSIEDYWNNRTLKISPLEQVELLKKLHDGDMQCKIENMEAVREAMLLTNESGAKLYGKTGTGKTGNTETMGWFIGYLETDDNTYVFAINIQNPAGASGNDAVQITYSIFEKMGILTI